MKWQEIRVDSLGKVVTGKTPSTKVTEFFDGEYMFVTPTDLDFMHYYCHSTETTVTEEAKNKHKNMFIPENSIMFTCIGNTIGKCAISSAPCLTNQQINSIVPDNAEHAKFIYYLLNYHKDIFRGIGLSGGVATPIINKTQFSNVRIRVPQKDIWRKIGDVLSAYDDLIENNRRRIQLLEESARLLYREWFVDLRFPGHEHVKVKDGVPEGWERKTLGVLGEIITGKTPSTKDEDNFGEEIPFVKTPDMHGNPVVVNTEQYLSEKGMKTQSNKTIPPYSIMVTCIGTAGIVSFNAYPSQTNQQINSIVPKYNHYRYFTYCLMSTMKPRLEGIGGGVTMTNVNKNKFSSLDFILPVDRLLHEFNDYADASFNQITKLIEYNIKLTEARDLLLPRLMNGEIEV